MNAGARFGIPFSLKLLLGLLLFAGMFVVAMTTGAVDVSFRDVWLAAATQADGDKPLMIREIRLPRELAAVFVGAALAVSGAIMQGMTRNPLADPGLLGVTAGANAALAATMAFLPATSYYGITIACFVGAAAGAALVFGIGTMRRGGFSPIRIVLAGAAVSSFLYAVAEGVGLYFKISKDVSMWTAGGIIGTTWSQLQLIGPLIGCGLIGALLLSRQLTVLSLSEEVAAGLGQRILFVKTALLGIVVLLAGASVALVGSLAFLGLIVPHVVRAVVGTDYRYILPMSAVGGAALMLLADTIARTVNAPYETPVAAVIAMMGIPFFLAIVHRGGRTSS
ncbi:iron ABC transporter permease [Paenibacillus antri]|uniref:Iron ABC transporter permease n=1 Tax=Paenibacillus antri TaxID=2582848 RepID=A0A5R9FYZ9_9BACL|nr:iron ABC transporter permease [Paenibacillus antri]TLS48731.1 iron ABC transporter permease [Paenibacillus antri]